MKKLHILIISLILVFALSSFTGCGLSSVDVSGEQDTDYIVYSNGGSAVQYGNYVYFINGTAGYENVDGDLNDWGDVEKGALYRAELSGSKAGREFETKTYTSDLTDFDFDFDFYEGEDYDAEPIDVVSNELIAPKVIGTSAYTSGGIYIYDEYVYFASPNNQKDKYGVVKTAFTDFYRMGLDGSDPELIYTTEDSAYDQPYAFYHAGYNDKGEGIVYMVCYWDTTIVSVKMEGKKIGNPLTITEDATSAYFPTRSTFDSENLEYGLEDFIFYTRDVVAGEDSVRSGNVIEVSLPDGSEGFSYHMNSETTEIKDVRDGLLFHTTTTTLGYTKVLYTDLNEKIKDIPHYANTGAKANDATVSGTVFEGTNFSDFTTTYFFRGDTQNNKALMLGVTSSAVYLLSDYGDYASGVALLNESITILMIDDGYIYYNKSSSTDLYRTSLYTSYYDKWTNNDGEVEELLSDRTVISAGYTVDVVAGHIMFFAQYDEWADAYSYFKKLSPGSESFFVGTIAEDDERPDDWDEEDETTDETTDETVTE